MTAICGLVHVNAQFFEKVDYLGALSPDANKDGTKGWTQWNPKNATYATATDSTTLNNSSGKLEITSTLTLNASTVYLLKTMLVIKSGGKLIVPAGSLIRCRANINVSPKEYATISVERGGLIDIQGTLSNPVVFTSVKPVGSRDRGDWGGILLCGNAVNNQGASIQMEGFNNVAFDNQLAFYGGNNDADNSGSITYCRLEFGGFAFEANKEINGLTFGSVGSKTKIDNVQVSFSGDDSYEWFGGTVNCKHLIAYKGTDDDFDTDFGFRGGVQFGIGQKDSSYFDLTWSASSGASTSECFESDNDAAGSGKLPLTAAVFTNMTCVGPVPIGGNWASLGTTTKGAFRRGARIRRNSRISITNSVFMGYRNFVMFDGDSTLTASGVLPSNTVSSVNNFIRNNYFCNTAAAAARTATNTGLVEISAGRNVDSLDNWIRKSINANQIDKASYTAGTVLVDPQNKTTPDFRPVKNNDLLANKSDYSSSIFNKFGSFTICDSILTQPKSLSLKTGNDAKFNIRYSTKDALFQWQNNKGAGYSNIQTGLQYTGITKDTLTVTNVSILNNGEKFRLMITTRFCKDSSSQATLTAILRTCNLITTQPLNVTKTLGSNADFNVSVNDNTALLNWQSDFELGMQSLPISSAKYAGANTKTLTVNSISLRNHSQPFRVIASTTQCVDTSNLVNLKIQDTCINVKNITVTDTLKINISLKSGPTAIANMVKVFPNPAKSNITVDNGNYALMGGYTIKIYDAVGKLMYIQAVNQKTYTINLSAYTVGVYSLQILDNSNKPVAVKSILIN